MSKLIKNNNKIIYSSYRQIPNSASAWTVTAGSLSTVGTGETGYVQAGAANTIASIANTQAYGEYYFDFYKGADANTMEVAFIASAVGIQMTYEGYLFRFFGTGESIRVTKSNIGSVSVLFVTAASYWSNNTWYQVKITRSATGVFTTYTRGGALENAWVLVSTAGGVGSNPTTDNTYTNSSYFVVDLDAGDRIANVRFKPSTGYHTTLTYL